MLFAASVPRLFPAGRDPFTSCLTKRVQAGTRNLLLTLDITNSGSLRKFGVGDHIAVYPKNDIEDVNKLVRRLTNGHMVDTKLKRQRKGKILSEK